MSDPIRYALAPAANDADGICQSQTPLAGGNLTINGALATGGVATIGAAGILRQVLFTFAGNETGRTFVVYGTNLAGAAISESVAGTATTAVTVQGFYTVTRITVDAATAGALMVGTNTVAWTPWNIVNYQIVPVNLGVAVIASGTVNYTWEYTYDDFLDVTVTPNVFSPPALTGKTTTIDATVAYPMRGWRLKLNSFTAPGSATVTVIPAGIRN